HRTSTYDDLTFYSSFPLLMRGIHGYRVISGYLFLFRILMKNSQPERVDSVSVPRNLKGELLDTDSIHSVLVRLNGNRSGRIVYVNEGVHSRIEGKVPCLRNRTPGRQYVYDNDALSRLEGGDFDAVPINQSISVGVFRKILPQYNGAAEYCQVFLARRLSEIGCKYLNDGDDADRPGLRDLKSKFHPIHTFDTFAYKLAG